MRSAQPPHFGSFIVLWVGSSHPKFQLGGHFYGQIFGSPLYGLALCKAALVRPKGANAGKKTLGQALHKVLQNRAGNPKSAVLTTGNGGLCQNQRTTLRVFTQQVAQTCALGACSKRLKDLFLTRICALCTLIVRTFTYIVKGFFCHLFFYDEEL